MRTDIHFNKSLEELPIPISHWMGMTDTTFTQDNFDSTMEQAYNLAFHPLTRARVSIMADGHPGMGMPIGGVIGCEKGLIPNAVGSDAGCGVLFTQLTLKASGLTIDNLINIVDEIYNRIPIGFGEWREEPNKDFKMIVPDIRFIQDQTENLKLQMGTLGGNNHFIDILADKDDFLCIMVHCGSRNLGSKINTEYNKRALKMCKRWYSSIPNEQLAFLPIGEKDTREYIKALEFAVDFAYNNRASIVKSVIEIIHEELSRRIVVGSTVNSTHNYAVQENHFSKNLWVHRKGAIKLQEGTLGVVPGSMGTSSYIVRGLGNKLSFDSCSHGAGRIMSKTKANETFKKEDVEEHMNREGIIFPSFTQDRKGRWNVCESHFAYKDIEKVISNQADICEPINRLTPLAVIMG